MAKAEIEKDQLKINASSILCDQQCEHTCRHTCTLIYPTVTVSCGQYSLTSNATFTFYPTFWISSAFLFGFVAFLVVAAFCSVSLSMRQSLRSYKMLKDSQSLCGFSFGCVAPFCCYHCCCCFCCCCWRPMSLLLRLTHVGTYTYIDKYNLTRHEAHALLSIWAICECLCVLPLSRKLTYHVGFPNTRIHLRSNIPLGRVSQRRHWRECQFQ